MTRCPALRAARVSRRLSAPALVCGSVLVLACASLREQSTALPAVAAPDTSLVVHGAAEFDWRLRTLDGEVVRFDAYRGEVVFLNVWATWCAPCVAELGSIARLRDTLEGEDVVFLTVSPEDAAPVREFQRRYGADLPVLLELDDVPAEFGLRALPTTYVVDRAGTIVLRHRGAADWDDDAVRAFLRHLARGSSDAAR